VRVACDTGKAAGIPSVLPRQAEEIKSVHSGHAAFVARVAALVGRALRYNRSLLALARSLGFKATISSKNETMLVRLDLDPVT
jgi:hypothetical protein